MNLPYMKNGSRAGRQQILEFKGLQYGKTTQDGELAETLNLSSRQWPALCQRRGRTVVGTYTSPTAIYAKDKVVVIDGTNVIYDGKTVGQVKAGEKQIVNVAEKVCIFPDKAYYDTQSGVFGEMAVSVSIQATFTTDTLTASADPAEGKTLEDLFAINQAVEISGSANNDQTIVVRGVDGNKMTFYSDSFKEESDVNITLSRNVPDLEYICEGGNRLWGVDGKTIWASALGDPLTFYNYDGLSTDSYAVAIGTEGKFTGCIGYSSNVLFFKENELYKMLGSEPSEYRMYTYSVPGVQSGSSNSMVVINEVLYYKGVHGVYGYTGGAPTLLSSNFGERRFNNANAGTDGQNYYISMQENAAWHLFVYDTLNGIWMRQDESHVLGFARQESELLALAGTHVYKLTEDVDEDIKWMAELAPFDWTLPERKQYTRLYIQAELEAGSHMTVEVKEDAGLWRNVFVHSAVRKKNMAIPIAPNKCDTLRVRLSGKGKCLVRQVTREVVAGGSR